MFKNVSIKQKNGSTVITGEKTDGSIEVLPSGVKEISINRVYKEVATISVTYFVYGEINDETPCAWGLEEAK